MNDALTNIGLPLAVITAIFAFIIFFIFAYRSDKKRKKQIEYELDHPSVPLEQEYHVRVSDMKCGTVISGSSKNPVSRKEFYVIFDILDQEGEFIGEPMTLVLDEDTYLSLDIGMTGYIAISGDVFLGFIPENSEQ